MEIIAMEDAREPVGESAGRSWREETLQAVQARTEVELAPLAHATRHLRTQVLPGQLEHGDDGEARLIWWLQNGVPSEPVGDCFWDLIALHDASDVELAGFARRFGPLYWPYPDVRYGESKWGIDLERGHRQASAGSEPVGPSSDAFSEPLWAWRSYARGLRALFKVVDANAHAEGIDPDVPGPALAAVAVPLLLRSGEILKQPPTEDDLFALIAEHMLDGTHGHDGFPFDQIVSAALQLAGIGAAFVSDRTRRQPVYSIPASVLRPTRPGKWEGVWQVQGLMPVLATSLAVVARHPERSLCTWCGKPAAIIGRRRRRNLPWFGDHASCRSQARAASLRRAEDRRTQGRRS